MRPWRWGVPRVAGLAVALPLLWGCTEDPLTGTDPDTAPGPTVETREVRLEATTLPLWRDTSFSGFALPGDAGFLLVASDDEIRARALARFAVPDSVTQFGDTLFVGVDRYENASFFVRMDTLASVFPPFPFTLDLHALARPFDEAGATWTLAAPGEPWATPGGDLGPRLASFTVDAVRDTLRASLDVSTDSLLQAWAGAGGDPGMAIRVEAPGARIRLTTLLLEFDARVDGVDAPFPQSRAPAPGIFIYTPEQPPPGARLRVGGLPAWRWYLEFRLPEIVDGIAVADAAVSHAELVFQPLEAPEAPFVPSASLTGQAVQLLADPFELGPKTPIGPGGALLALDPDSLATGKPVRVDVTDPVRTRLLEDEPSSPIRIGIRGSPDPQSLGFWEFGSAEAASPSLRPALLLIFSRPPSFEVP